MGIFDFFKRKKKKDIKDNIINEDNITNNDQGVTAASLFKEDNINESNKFSECKLSNYKKFDEDCIINNKENTYLINVLEEVELDKNKESILLLDDNAGVLSFLMDDLKILKKQGTFDYTKYNVLKFDSKLAGFKLRSALFSNQKLNIKYAIFDITLGGAMFNSEGENISLDGVDCYLDAVKYYPEMKYIFYTGNKLNPYIRKNQEILSKFEKATDEEIEEHILFKTTLSREDRQAYLLEFFTK